MKFGFKIHDDKVQIRDCYGNLIVELKPDMNMKLPDILSLARTIEFALNDAYKYGKKDKLTEITAALGIEELVSKIANSVAESVVDAKVFGKEP